MRSCIKQCKKSPDGTHCVGCKRMIKEIVAKGRLRKMKSNERICLYFNPEQYDFFLYDESEHFVDNQISHMKMETYSYEEKEQAKQDFLDYCEFIWDNKIGV